MSRSGLIPSQIRAVRIACQGPRNQEVGRSAPGLPAPCRGYRPADQGPLGEIAVADRQGRAGSARCKQSSQAVVPLRGSYGKQVGSHDVPVRALDGCPTAGNDVPGRPSVQRQPDKRGDTLHRPALAQARRSNGIHEFAGRPHIKTAKDSRDQRCQGRAYREVTACVGDPVGEKGLLRHCADQASADQVRGAATGCESHDARHTKCPIDTVCAACRDCSRSPCSRSLSSRVSMGRCTQPLLNSQRSRITGSAGARRSYRSCHGPIRSVSLNASLSPKFRCHQIFWRRASRRRSLSASADSSPTNSAMWDRRLWTCSSLYHLPFNFIILKSLFNTGQESSHESITEN